MASRHWFEDVADFLGPAYLRYSFTKGTVREVESLIELLELRPGDRVLDVGCGPGRHSLELARRGIQVLGVDISGRFIEVAVAQSAEAGLADLARFEVGDAANGTWDQEFDAVISLCQGAFGLSGGLGIDVGRELSVPVELDEPIMASMANALVEGGRLAVTGFSAYFQVRFLEQHDTFDPGQGVNHEHTTLTNDAGETRPAELWTSCFTPRELRLLARAYGLEPVAVYGVTPGRYQPSPVTLDDPELLLVARRRPL